MTAEIALMNKLAVTLAADSAVTISSGHQSKVYNSADKIFEGTNYDPIGVMVYNKPDLNGVPVEAIVKMYRDRNCSTHFSTVFDYAEAFLEHLEDIETPDVTISDNIYSLVSDRATDLRDQLRSLTDDIFQSASATEQDTTVENLREALDVSAIEFLDREIATLLVAQEQKWAAGMSDADVIASHSESINQVVDLAFGDDRLPDDRRARIVTILAWSLLKEFQRPQLTGLVFAGFGESEIFPSLVSYEIYGLVAGKLKFVQTTKFDVDRKLVPDAAVLPFAQKEMVDRFMYGLDGDFLDLCDTYFSGANEALKIELENHLAGCDEAVRGAVAPAIDAILGEFRSQIVPGHLNRLRQEFSEMVRSMPKQELAALSESLVHMTSLKRKFSAGAESVGGPIDVAMITRAEGFVWVKRKHYFDPNLNPRYFHRRYGKGSDVRSDPGPKPDEAR